METLQPTRRLSEPTSNASPSPSAQNSTRGRSPASTVPQKRSRTRSGSRRDIRSKRRHYRDEYRVILNEEISRAADPYSPQTDELSEFHDTQIGFSSWTADEKSRFFASLDRYGRLDLASVAKAVGSKSVLEVQQYLDFLSLGLREQHREMRRETLLRYADIPAAYEVIVEGCKALERAGDGLQAFVGPEEDTREKAKWGRWWRLTQPVAWEIEDRLEAEAGSDREDDEDEREVEDGFERLRPSAELFDLPMWLELSERVFLNSPARDERDGADEGTPRHWLDVTGNTQDTPAINATAFEDFYSLVVSVTKRIVITSIIQATTRLRATNVRNNQQRKEVVGKRDVRTALDILRMKHNSNDFWVGAARRLGFHVYDPKYRKKNDLRTKRSLGPKLKYEDVESMLRLPWEMWKKHHNRHTHEVLSKLSQAGKSDSDLSDTDLDVPTLPDSTPSDDLAARHEDEADTLDLLASYEHEHSLWTDAIGQMLPPRLLKPEHAEAAVDEHPPIQRKREEDFVDWCQGLDYQDEWERSYLFDFAATRESVTRRKTKRRALREKGEGERSEGDSEENNDWEGNHYDRGDADDSDVHDDTGSEVEPSNEDSDSNDTSRTSSSSSGNSPTRAGTSASRSRGHSSMSYESGNANELMDYEQSSDQESNTSESNEDIAKHTQSSGPEQAGSHYDSSGSDSCSQIDTSENRNEDHEDST